MGERRVDLLHLLQDLADAYPGDLHDTILTEIVANALASGSTRIRFVTDASAPALTVVDDGIGMRRADLRRFHDLACSTKTRGQGISFAGVGIKLGLLAARWMQVKTSAVRLLKQYCRRASPRHGLAESMDQCRR